MTRTIIIAGATGSVGRALIKLARGRGYRTVALGRNRARLETCGADEVRVTDFTPGSLMGAIQAGDIVFSALGASCSPSPFMGWKTYRMVDVPLNTALLNVATKAGAARFMYVSLAFGRELRRHAFADAHETVVDRVVASGLPYTILRPTGIFSTFRRLWGFAKLGVFPVPGKPDVKSNPIHEEDIAAAALDSIDQPSTELDLGGPEVFTRREMAQVMLRTAGRPRGIALWLPGWFHLLCANLLWLASPRAGQMLKFYLVISVFDNVVPTAGKQRLEDYYQQKARQSPGIIGGMHRSAW
ncbi:MAG: NAD(P)H-binding protein [Planctomycetes bacterium]|nr:NAD(P)H-binding protein [Planctomycetota bacterium]MCW8134637.1 NAD(P)H-binding protein [Planctomycetota bacterium]